MTDVPRFSVTTPAYNAEDTLADTIESVQAQTFADWEMVIVDDGSTDATRALAQGYAERDARIRVISQENRGSGGAHNTAARNAAAGLLVMLSADDLLLPDHLARFDRFIDANPDAGLYSCNGYYLYDDGVRELSRLNEGWADPVGASMSDLLHACFFATGTVFRREVFDAVGGFPEDLYAEDYVFFMLALARGFEHRYLDMPLAVHRRNTVQKSADAARVRKADVVAIERVLATGLLSSDEVAVARGMIRRHRRNAAVRFVLGGLLGQERSARLIDRLRDRHTA
jgi:glycosyltransferase involved in cell wall biosynthesis